MSQKVKCETVHSGLFLCRLLESKEIMFLHASFLKKKVMHYSFLSWKLGVKCYGCFNQNEFIVLEFFYIFLCGAHIAQCYVEIVLSRVRSEMSQHCESIKCAIATVHSVCFECCSWGTANVWSSTDWIFWRTKAWHFLALRHFSIYRPGPHFR